MCVYLLLLLFFLISFSILFFFSYLFFNFFEPKNIFLHFNITKLTLVNYLLRFHILITTKCHGHYIHYLHFYLSEMHVIIGLTGPSRSKALINLV